MSALGQKRTCAAQKAMSALPRKRTGAAHKPMSALSGTHVKRPAMQFPEGNRFAILLSNSNGSVDFSRSAVDNAHE